MAIKGKLDRVDRHASGALTVIDYKTGRGPDLSKKRQAEDPTDGGNVLQGLWYASLARQNNPGTEEVRSAYWSLSAPPDKIEFVRGTHRREHRVARRRVDLARRMIEEGSVPMRPVDTFPVGLCGRCAYRTICPGDREAIALSQERNATGAFREFLSVGKDEEGDE